MVKIMCFLNRKPGMTMAEFREYYETRHAPLASRLLPFFDSYKRNFASEVQDYETGHLENKAGSDAPFDVITEMTFKTQADYQKMVDALGDPEIGGEIARDEENLFDRGAMRIYLVDEYQ